MSEKYTIGIDYGTLSGRALLVRVSDGVKIADSVCEYTHGVMDEYLPCADGEKIPLGEGWALEHPEDYLEVLAVTIPELLEKSGVSADDVIGIGVDFTASSVIPVYADKTPLCFDPKFASNPYAYVRLWKDHSSSKYAVRMTQIARERGEEWLERYGGELQGEWLVPKAWQTLEEAPEVYAAADYFMECGDWINWVLTGEQTRSESIAGFKAFYIDGKYPSHDYFAALDKRMRCFAEEKLGYGKVKMLPVGSVCGTIRESAAALTHLKVGTPVVTSIADAHAAVVSVGLRKSGDMLLILGTSAIQMLIDDAYVPVPGICGVVNGGYIPGMYAYEAGQRCMGDHFSWFAERFTPSECLEEAKARGVKPIRVLCEKMAALKPGESGLIALDWWNGNRSILADAELSGLFIGMTLTTKPEEMFRALVEATAFGCRVIVDNYKNGGIAINSIVASGGIASKDPVTMQIYADVLGCDIAISSQPDASAHGMAVFAALASGYYKTIAEAEEHMTAAPTKVYRPIEENVRVYNELFEEFRLLHDYFGGENDVMKRLLAIRRRCR